MLRSHCTGLSLDVESSKTSDGNVEDSGTSPPVARATACWIASREWSFWVETVNSLKSGLAALLSSQKQERTLPSEAASARDGAAALLEHRQRADQRRAEVGHDHVDVLVLRDR